MIGVIERCIDCDRPLPECTCADRLRCSCGVPDEACLCAGKYVPAKQLRGVVDALDEAIKAARTFNRNGMTWMEYDRRLAELEQFANQVRGQ